MISRTTGLKHEQVEKLHEELIKQAIQNAQEKNNLIEKFSLLPHPEGGLYHEIYRAADFVKPIDSRYNGEERSAATIIYYLLGGDDFSSWHKVISDESWQYCSGSSLTLYFIDQNAELKKIKTGNPALEEDAVYQFTILPF